MTGNLAKSTDQGATWTLITTGSTGFQEMHWWDVNNGIIIGTNSVVLKTTDGGLTWQNNPIPVPAFLKDVDFESPNIGVVVGQNTSTFAGIIYKTIDGGITWTALTGPFSQTYNSVDLISATNYILGATEGFLIETTTGGASFSTINTGSSNGVNDLLMTSSLDGIFVGDRGQIQLFTCPAVVPLIQENQTFCEGSQLSDVVLTIGNPKWYSDEFLGLELPDSTVLSSSNTYYVTNNTGGCESILFANFTPTIISTPAPSGATTQDFCIEAFVSDLTVSGTSIVWYDAPSNGNVLNLFDALSDGSTLYASQTLNGCESLNLLTVDVVIDNPIVTGALQQTFCIGALISDIDVTGQNIQWYDAASGGNLLLETDVIQDGLVYYASATENGCEGTNRLSVAVSINPALDLGVSQQLGVFSAAANSMNYQWIDCNNGNQIISGETNQQFTPTTNGSYAVIINDGLCQDTSVCLTITNVGLNQIDHTHFDVFPNPTSEDLFITNLSLFNSSEGSFDYQILTIEGKLILSGKLNSLNDKINVRSFSSGTYYLKLDGFDVPIKWIKN
ncbi:MAG: T9SS type A sorting domain-containing protein [Fluviicola sp.]